MERASEAEANNVFILKLYLLFGKSILELPKGTRPERPATRAALEPMTHFPRDKGK